MRVSVYTCFLASAVSKTVPLPQITQLQTVHHAESKAPATPQYESVAAQSTGKGANLYRSISDWQPTNRQYAFGYRKDATPTYRSEIPTKGSALLQKNAQGIPLTTPYAHGKSNPASAFDFGAAATTLYTGGQGVTPLSGLIGKAPRHVGTEYIPQLPQQFSTGKYAQTRFSPTPYGQSLPYGEALSYEQALPHQQTSPYGQPNYSQSAYGSTQYSQTSGQLAEPQTQYTPGFYYSAQHLPYTYIPVTENQPSAPVLVIEESEEDAKGIELTEEEEEGSTEGEEKDTEAEGGEDTEAEGGEDTEAEGGEDTEAEEGDKIEGDKEAHAGDDGDHSNDAEEKDQTAKAEEIES